jgi:hypothetical protein
MQSLITNSADLYEQLGEGQLANPGGISLQLTLKGPKLEISGPGVFSQIRPVWVADLGTWPKIQNVDVWGFLYTLYFLALMATSL